MWLESDQAVRENSLILKSSVAELVDALNIDEWKKPLPDSMQKAIVKNRIQVRVLSLLQIKKEVIYDYSSICINDSVYRYFNKGDNRLL